MLHGMVSSKVHVGSSLDGQKVVPEDIQHEIQEKWETVVTGCATYQEVHAQSIEGGKEQAKMTWSLPNESITLC